MSHRPILRFAVAFAATSALLGPVAAQAQSVTCTSGANGLCFCLDTFCDPIANFGMPVPIGNPGCQDGCIVGSTCSCKGPFICSQSVGIPGAGGKTGTCKF